MIIFIRNLKNRQVRKVIVHYFSERSEGFKVFDGFSQTGRADGNTPNATGIRVKKIYKK